ncbi:MAG TPA: hypothetical protein VJN70_09995 [Gemmatimonadaceae bacterium]|nr:hypothetical protein [Gemmatimonadaceae bacterium]
MRVFLALLAALALATPVAGQEQQAKKKKDKEPAQLELVPHDPARIFTADAPLTFTLTANLGRLRRDKTQTPPWREATIAYADSADGTVEVPLKVRTRGIWRLNNCDFPPIRLDFKKSDAKHSEFTKLDKPKLVTYCKDNDEFEQYVLQEFQLYRVYNVLTRYSHRVRLAKISYADSGNGKVQAIRYGFIEEEPTDLASRVGGMLIKGKGAGPSELDMRSAAIFFLFQYMIGNTDWSVSAQHNVELVTSDSGDYVPIAYDFDFSGAVNTRYATTDARLPIRRVRDRLYRGYCLPNEVYAPIFALFAAKKDSIYALYHDSIGQLLTGDRAKQTLEYFDDFYKTIGDRSDAKHEITDRCLRG